MKYKLGIIGYGGMGRHHAERIRKRVDCVEVVGAYDVREERMEAARKDGYRTYASVDELLADGEIDIVTIATPNNFHKDQTIRALRAGKHVVCEKPVALNSDELIEMTAAAREIGKVFTVHQNRRWDRDFVIVKTAIEQGKLGKPFFIESRVAGSNGVLYEWRGYKVNGGGMLYDWGVHLIDQLLWMIDSPVISVYASLKKIFCKECDDNFKLFLKFENGIDADIEIDTYNFIPLPRWHVVGDRATLNVDDWACHGKILSARGEGVEWSETIVYTEAGPTRSMAPRPKETILEEPLPQVKSDWSEFYKNVCAAIEGRESLIVTPEQALRVMRVVDAAFKSDAENRSIQTRI
jgi:predicted dehydrogenase